MSAAAGDELTSEPEGKSGSLSFDRIADQYDETRGGEDRGRRFAVELAPLLDASLPVLELGVGTGVVALGLQELGFRVLGLDLSFAMLERARHRIGPRLARGDLRRLPVATGSVDQALCVWVLHVTGDVGLALAEVARILRPGGRFLVVPAVAGDPNDEVNRLIWDMHRNLDPAGARRDDPERLEALAPAAGFRFAGTNAWLPFDYEERPAETLRKLETRSFSSLWNASDEQWEAIVKPVIEAIRAMPDLERPIVRRSTDKVVLLVKEG
jgi:ubiquinone/menaquinone biosynthesis C-methylase UbiE